MSSTDTGPTANTTIEVSPSERAIEHRGLPKLIRRLAIPIILGWIVFIGVFNTVVPELDVVGRMRAVTMTPETAPSIVAMKRIGEVFDEFTYNSSAMVVLEGEEPLGTDAHRYYSAILAELRADTDHVEHVQDLWNDPLTAAGVQSPDGKAAYVQVYAVGNQGDETANQSIEAIRQTVEGVAAPPGIKAYVAGAAALAYDQQAAGDRSRPLIQGLTFLVIIVMLLIVYRSITTVALVLAMVILQLLTARGFVAFLGFHRIIDLSTFATSLLSTLAIAAATDYAIFLIGRYQEARSRGKSREAAYYEMFHGTAHVILGSGLTIAGAALCLHLTNLPYLKTLGIPLAIGMVIVVLAALTLVPAVIAVATRFGSLLEPTRAMRIRGWRKVGAAVVRWPVPILVASSALALVGLLTLPGYETNYDDRNFLPEDVPANLGYAAADRHFSAARLNPEVLLIETDHDMRNPADFLVINKVAKKIADLHGIARVQAITRPQGVPIEHTSIPYLLSQQGIVQQLNQQYSEARTADMLKQADDIQHTIESMEAMNAVTIGLADTTHSMVTKMTDMVGDIEQLRDRIADFDDFFRPLRSYLYWEPHCFDIPVCHALRAVFDAVDSIDIMTDDIAGLMPDMQRLDELMPQMVAMLPSMIDTMKSMKTMVLTMYQTQNGIQQQMKEMQENSLAMGKAFDAAQNDDSFYLPPETFTNPDFERGIQQFLSPDGKAVRLIVSLQGDPLTAEGLSHVDQIKVAAEDAIKNTPLEGSKIGLAGSAATFKDMQNTANYDLIIAGTASLALIFIIMLIVTRSIVAAGVIVGTVVFSLGSAFGLSVLVWQHFVGLQLHWMVVAMSVIILLAVGADYNLLLVSRMKEEIRAGLNTGIIRAMGGTGSVVTSAGLVFAFTMASMVVSDLKVIAQVGTTIGLGLLFDTLVIRAFMTPSVAALLGRWFWWPQRVRQRPVPVPWPTPCAATTHP